MKPVLKFLTALILAPLIAVNAADSSAKKPNIIVILVDDMGYRGPQCFNAQSKITTSDIRTAA